MSTNIIGHIAVVEDEGEQLAHRLQLPPRVVVGGFLVAEGIGERMTMLLAIGLPQLAFDPLGFLLGAEVGRHPGSHHRLRCARTPSASAAMITDRSGMDAASAAASRGRRLRDRWLLLHERVA